MIQRVLINGSVVSNRTTTIMMPYDGYIRRLFVETGDQVKAGDPLVTVSLLSRSPEAELFPIVAPFSGSVVQVFKTEGEYTEKISSGSGKNSILRVDDLSKVYINADVPEIDMPHLKIGQTGVVKAISLPHKTYQGKIVEIARASKAVEGWDRGRVEFPVRLLITDADSSLVPGMSVSADVVTNEVKDVLVLRHEFVQKEGDKFSVMDALGKTIPIEVGSQNEEFVEIKSGLAEGAKVKGVDFLKL